MIEADYYDGRSSRRQPVSVFIRGATIELAGPGVRRVESLAAADVSEPLETAPRLIRFADGAFCQVAESPELKAALAGAGRGDDWIVRWQARWGWALASLVAIGAIAVAGYVHGLPWAAEKAAGQLPHAVAATLSDGAMDALDGRLLQESELAAGRATELQAAFAQLRHKAPVPASRLLLRSSPALGPNAFALPDGTIVLLDELVDIAQSDEQIQAVLAHELGHVQHRHGLRQLLQGTAVGAFTAWWFGDVSTLLVIAPTAVLQSRYSRAFESEADAYAADLLLSLGVAPARLAEILDRIAQAHGMNAQKKEGEWSDYLSSHPAPAERMEALRARGS